MASRSASAPILNPDIRAVWLDDHTLWIGEDPTCSVRIGGLPARTRELVDLFDGTQSIAAVSRFADHVGIPPIRFGAAIKQLIDAGVLLHSPPPPRRLTAHVRINGTGQLIAPLAIALVASGLTGLSFGSTQPVRLRDLGPLGLTEDLIDLPFRTALRRLLRRRCHLKRQPPRTPPDLTVTIRGQLFDPLIRSELHRNHLTHLDVRVLAGSARFGPLVTPGRTPCMHCLELTTRDIEPDWPAISLGLARYQPTLDSAPDPATLGIAAAALAGLILAWCESGGAGHPLAGAFIVFDRSTLGQRRLAFGFHPECDCSGTAGC